MAFVNLSLLPFLFGSLINPGCGLEFPANSEVQVARVQHKHLVNTNKLEVKSELKPSGDELIEVVDEDVKRPVENRMPPGQPVADSLVEVVEEKENFKPKAVAIKGRDRDVNYHRNSLFKTGIRLPTSLKASPHMVKIATKAHVIGRVRGRKKQRNARWHSVSAKQVLRGPHSVPRTKNRPATPTKKHMVPSPFSRKLSPQIISNASMKITTVARPPLLITEKQREKGNQGQIASVSKSTSNKWIIDQWSFLLHGKKNSSKNFVRVHVGRPKSVPSSSQLTHASKTSQNLNRGINGTSKGYEMEPSINSKTYNTTTEINLIGGIHTLGYISATPKNLSNHDAKQKTQGQIKPTATHTISGGSGKGNATKVRSDSKSGQRPSTTVIRGPVVVENVKIQGERNESSHQRTKPSNPFLQKTTTVPEESPTIAQRFKDLVNFFNSFLHQTDNHTSQNHMGEKGNLTEKLQNMVKIPDHSAPIKSSHKQLNVSVDATHSVTGNSGTGNGTTTMEETRKKQRDRERLQMSIIIGWNRANKRRNYKSANKNAIKGWKKSHRKSKQPYVNITVMVNPGSIHKSKKIGFVQGLTTMIGNISWNEFLRLKNDIIKALTPGGQTYGQRDATKQLEHQNFDDSQRLRGNNGRKRQREEQMLKPFAYRARHQKGQYKGLHSRGKDLQNRTQTQRLEHRKVFYQKQLEEKKPHRLLPTQQLDKKPRKQSSSMKMVSQQLTPHSTQSHEGLTREQNRLGNLVKNSQSHKTQGSIKVILQDNQQQATKPLHSLTEVTKDVNGVKENCSFVKVKANVGVFLSSSKGCSQTMFKKVIAHTSSEQSSLNTMQTTARVEAGVPLPTITLADNTAKDVLAGNATPLFTSASNKAETDIDSKTLVEVYQSNLPSEEVPREPIKEGGQGVMEMTEFVDEEPERERSITKFSDWSSCTATCGAEAIRQRVQYTCKSTAKRTRDCTIVGKQQKTCALNPCPVNGAFTTWSRWGSCSRSCGTMGISVRTRSCTNPIPSNGGQSCNGDGVQTRSCGQMHCPVDGGLTQWSRFGPCTHSCRGGIRIRRRHCTNPAPQYGGRDCVPLARIEKQRCNTMPCPAKILKRPQVANVDPKSLCDFDPCQEAGCIFDPTAKCITDFECNPVFFNSQGKMLSECKGMKNLFSRIPEVICRFNPCLTPKCWIFKDYCVVDLKCRPVYVGIAKQAIPRRCQVDGTARVDRVNPDRMLNKPRTVNLAPGMKPSLTKLWYPVIPLRMNQPLYSPSQIEQQARPDVRVISILPHRATMPTERNPVGIRRPQVQSPFPEQVMEVVPMGPAYLAASLNADFFNDDDDDDDDDDAYDGYVHDDVDEDDDFRK